MSEFSFDFNYLRSGTPLVTLSSLGIAFNAGARNMLGYPAQVNIGFDDKANVIGVCEHNEDSKLPKYEFEGREKNNWVRISARDFMKYLAHVTEIDFLSKAKQFIPFFDEEKKMLIIVVDEEHLKK